MTDKSRTRFGGEPEQRAIRMKCFHPTGTFIEFKQEEVEQSIPERFEKITAQHCDRIAIETHDTVLTYADVNWSVNSIAHGLIQNLEHALAPIILISDHGPVGIIGCLAIFIAGKILIAIDPSFPLSRAKQIREESGAIAILTDDRNVSFATKLATQACPLLNIEMLRRAFAPANLNVKLAAGDPVEIRYSSGSTGEPKGIVRSHRKLLHTTMLSINSAHICPEDRLLALRRLSFGSSDILKGLLAGAAVCPFDITKFGFASMADLINRQKVTYFTSSSSIFRALIGELDGKKYSFPSVRMLQIGDEPLNKTDVEAYKKLFPDNCILMHRLSCGEAGNICQYLIDKNTTIDTPIVPVGYPVEDKEIILLDEDGQEVPPGLNGEIAVRSRYLASEYWKKPEMTSAKFLPADNAGQERTYLTGDLGRKLGNGQLVYLGRKDFEIKIRGCKVALPEVEALLAQYEGVREAVVVAHEYNGDSQLVAYLVCTAGKAPAISELREVLRSQIPDYMIPSHFIILDALPLTTNGKLDRRALSRLERKIEENSPSGEAYVSPLTAMERAIAEAWQEVLGINRISTHDNFFDLGGHSLLSVKVAELVETRTGRRIQPRDMVMQTLGQIASKYETSAFVIHESSSQGLIRRWLGSVARLLHP